MNVELLKKAYAVIDGIPAKRINLDRLASNSRGGSASDPADCGTIACAIGWLGMHPEFRALGLRTASGQNDRSAEITWRGRESDFRDASAILFRINIDEADRLFCHRIESSKETDKQVFLTRLKRLLAKAEAA